MRDQETMEIGMRGALTGHLVLSTLHTNDAISSALRLMDMGAPGYLVAAALRTVIAQRLVRKICPYCKEVHELEPSEKTYIDMVIGEGSSNAVFKHGRGCQSCNFTGYAGRVGVFEVLELSVPMMDALRSNDTERFSKVAREDPNYRPLVMMAFDYAKQGVTTVDEVLHLAEVVK
jgi:MSHA biogenesis protein MshE